MVDSIQTRALEQLHNLPQEARLVILHPNYFSQHLLMAQFLQAESVVYVRCIQPCQSLDDLHAQLGQALAEQTESGTLVGVQTLILDECDRADKAAFDTFLLSIGSQMHTGRIVVVSRDVPAVVLHNAELRAQTTFVPTDDSLLLRNYSQVEMRDQEQPATVLEVRALGVGRVTLNGRRIDNWDGVLPRSLFFYLIDRGMATRSDIFAMFWPKLSTREATNVFHVTKRKINEVLGIDLTIYWSGFYRISPEIQLHYDVSMFTGMVQSADIAESAEAETELLRALELYRGNYLISNSMEWAANRRLELQQTYAEALGSLASLREQQNNLTEALNLYLRAAAVDSQREEIAGNVMRLYAALDQPVNALQAYARLENELQTRLKIVPTTQLQELAATIRNQAGKSSTASA